MNPQRRTAVVMFGGLLGVKHPAWVEAIVAEGAIVLDVDEDRPRMRELAALTANGEGTIGKIDEVFLVDPEAEGTIVARVGAWARRYEIVGVVNMLEVFVRPAALAADLLRLPHPGLRAAWVCRNKALQRAFLADHSPAHRIFASPAAAREAVGELAFPCVVKPAGRSGSAGVLRVDDPQRLLAVLHTYEGGETVLVEALVEGPEFSVETLVQRRRVVHAGVTAKRTLDCGSEPLVAEANGFVESGHTVPCPDPAVSELLLAANLAVLERLAFEDGVAHAEFKVGRDGRVYLMEIAARSPGDLILPLYELAHGEPLEAQAVRVAMGRPAAYPPARRIARQVYLAHTAGVLQDVVVDGSDVRPVFVKENQVRSPRPAPAADAPAALHEVVVDGFRGRPVPDITNSHDRVGSFVVHAPTAAELDRVEAEARAAIRLVTR